ncbi:Hsp20/alpha crystallin family protein [Aquibacillus sediminis]|uniref:Hsp20/alpha crystallin family protein n=1 Tax=Aquibacillus sediminis TaxID=2574734 RepID=UPI001108F4F6|nr:Hsp20/alpha crystallin family protein [Aquibacillus sediminis]
MANLLPRRNSDFRDVVDRMFDFFHRGFDDDFLSPMESRFFNSFKMDVKDKGNQLEIQAELPGLNKDDVIVEYKDEHIIIKAEQNENVDKKNEDGHYIRRERSYGSFQRSFYVGNIDETKIKGSFKNGVLTLKVPKGTELHDGYRVKID